MNLRNQVYFHARSERHLRRAEGASGMRAALAKNLSEQLLHLKGEQELPEALSQAQIWVRNCTAGRLANRFRREEELALGGRPRMPIETASAAFARFASQDSANRPFAHPFHWAAFTFSGA